MLEVIENKTLRESLIAGGFRYVELNGWDRRKSEYLELVDDLSTEDFSAPGSPTIATIQAD
jgi:hypothetical protein